MEENSRIQYYPLNPDDDVHFKIIDVDIQSDQLDRIEKKLDSVIDLLKDK